MKKGMIKLMKRTVVWILVIALNLAGCLIMDAEAKNEKSIVYQQFSDYEKYIGTKIPEYANAGDDGYGYLFGGWFKSADGSTYTPIETAEEGSEGKVYAKFVPAYVLSVKCQNKAGTTQATDSTNLKVISSVDSADYKKYGFELSIITLDGNGNLSTQSVFSSEKDVSDKVYEKFKVYDTEEDGTLKLQATKLPSDVFGEASAYFATWEITNIPKSSYGTIICVKPYWITMDQMRVYGLSKYVHVEDGFLHGSGEDTYRYVNVPVNIRNTQAVAAGMLNVDYSNYTDFALYEVEGGVIFEEMAWTDQGSSAKLVGNVKDITKNKQQDDIYANLRFKVPSKGVSDFANGYTFHVTGEEFCNIAEMKYTGYDVWNVKY